MTAYLPTAAGLDRRASGQRNNAPFHDLGGKHVSLLNKVTDFARGPQGRKLTGQAKRWASDPKNRRQIDDIRKRFAGRRPPGKN